METEAFHVSLREVLNERDKRYEQQFEAQKAAVAVALMSTREALAKAEAATEKRFESVNEFRGALNDAAKSFVTRVEVEAWREQNRDQVTNLAARVTTIEGLAQGREKSRIDINSLIMMGIGLSALAFSLFR